MLRLNKFFKVVALCNMLQTIPCISSLRCVYCNPLYMKVNIALHLSCIVCMCNKQKGDLLLEMFVVTAVTEAREMVSGSSIPARRIAFRSISSMSRTAGSSKGQAIINMIGRATTGATDEDIFIFSLKGFLKPMGFNFYNFKVGNI